MENLLEIQSILNNFVSLKSTKMNKVITVQNPEWDLKLNSSTGEVKELTIHKTVSNVDFVMMFLKSIPEICKLEGNMIKILLMCVLSSIYNPNGSETGNTIYNNKIFKQEIRNSGIDLTDVGIDSYISKLCKMNFLIKRCKGMYILNPKFFFKGTLTDAARLQFIIDNK